MRIALFGDPAEAAQIAALLQAQLAVEDRSPAYPACWPAGWVRVYLDAHLGSAAAGAEACAEATQPAAACPGCVGRGTGTVCCVCGGTIPAELRRSAGSPSELRPDCPGCRAGAAHTHTGSAGGPQVAEVSAGWDADASWSESRPRRR